MSPQIAGDQVPSTVTTTYSHQCQVFATELGHTPGEITYCRWHDQRVEVVDVVDPISGTYRPQPVPRCIETGIDLYLLARVRRDGVQL